MGIPFSTVGHFNRSLGGLIALLRDASIALVADIRTAPRLKISPQLDRSTLSDALATCGAFYEHMAPLGGLCERTRILSKNVNAFRDDKKFHNYADDAPSEPFHAGLLHLLDEKREQRCVVMYSEAFWWRYRCRIVADHLIAGEQAGFHIMGQGRLELTHMTSGAVIPPDGRIVHPARQAEA